MRAGQDLKNLGGVYAAASFSWDDDDEVRIYLLQTSKNQQSDWNFDQNKLMYDTYVPINHVNSNIILFGITLQYV